MTLFEFLTVAVSIVLSFGVVRLLDGLRPAFDPRRRYWVHAIWVLITLNSYALTWWSLWLVARDVEWNFARFVWLLLGPGILYLISSALVTEEPGSVPSWWDHYYEIRRWFLGACALFSLHIHLTGYFVYGQPLLSTGRLVGVSFLILPLIGLWSANPHLHAGIAVMYLTIQLVGLGSILFAPTLGA